MKTLDEAVSVVMGKTLLRDHDGDPDKVIQESKLRALDLHGRFSEIKQEVLESSDVCLLVQMLMESFPAGQAIHTAFLYGLMAGIEMERPEKIGGQE